MLRLFGNPNTPARMKTLTAFLAFGRALLPLFAFVLALSTAFAAPKVAVLLGDSVSPFGREVAKGFAEIGPAHGFAIVVKAPPSAENVAQMQRLLAGWENDADLKGIVIACGLGANELGKSLQPFLTRNIPVIALLGHLPAGVAKSTVLVDENAVAAAAIEQCLRLVSAGDEVGLLRSNLREGQMNDRERLVIRGLHERYPALPIHADVFMKAEGSPPAEQAKLLIEKHPKTTLNYTPYTTATLAKIDAIRETGRAGHIHHVGIGAGLPPECERAIERGELDALIAIAPRDVADKAVLAMVDILAGKTVPEVVYSSVQIATKDGVRAASTEASR